MITLKAIHTDGAEVVFEVKTFGYSPRNEKISYRAAENETGEIPLNRDVLVVYAMNSAGSTIGKYYNTSIESEKE